MAVKAVRWDFTIHRAGKYPVDGFATRLGELRSGLAIQSRLDGPAGKIIAATGEEWAIGEEVEENR